MEQDQNTSLFQLNIDGQSSNTLKNAASWAKILAIVGFIVAFLFVIFGVMMQSVMGKMSTGASISQFLIRWLLRDIWFLFLLGIGLQGAGRSAESVFIILAVLAYFITEVVLVISSKKGQRIGDILAKTILIRTNRQSSIEETVFQEVADTYTPSFPQIMRLSDRDINAIKTILETSRKKGDIDMAAAASEKIKAHLKIDSQLSPFEFLDILLKDYNYLSVK